MGTEHLTPWKDGQSGNPNGRPKGSRNRRTIIEKWADLAAAGDPNLTELDLVVLKLLEKAKTGDVTAAKEILDSMFGKNPDVIAGDPDNPLNTITTHAISETDRMIIDRYCNSRNKGEPND